MLSLLPLLVFLARVVWLAGHPSHTLPIPVATKVMVGVNRGCVLRGCVTLLH